MENEMKDVKQSAASEVARLEVELAIARTYKDRADSLTDTQATADILHTQYCRDHFPGDYSSCKWKEPTTVGAWDVKRNQYFLAQAQELHEVAGKVAVRSILSTLKNVR